MGKDYIYLNKTNICVCDSCQNGFETKTLFTSCIIMSTLSVFQTYKTTILISNYDVYLKKDNGSHIFLIMKRWRMTSKCYLKLARIEEKA